MASPTVTSGCWRRPCGDWDVRELHFEAALRLNRRMQAPTWLAHTQYEYARMLLARRRPGDADRASDLLLASAALPPARAFRVARTQRAADGGCIRRSARRTHSARELEVLQPRRPRRRNREIGTRLFISQNTAANHVRSILMKTRCANRTEAASYAHRNGCWSADRVGICSPHAALSDRTPLRRAAGRDERDNQRSVQAVNADEGVHWLFSFLSADKLRWYCLFEAPSPPPSKPRLAEPTCRRKRSSRSSSSTRPRCADSPLGGHEQRDRPGVAHDQALGPSSCGAPAAISALAQRRASAPAGQHDRPVAQADAAGRHGRHAPPRQTLKPRWWW